MSRIMVVVVAAVIVLSAASARAQEEARPKKVIELPECVVTPGRVEEPVAEITESITVITSAQLEESAAMDVVESLRTVPGLSFAQKGGLGGSATPYIRGTLGTQTVVLIDGIQVNDPTLGYQFDFDDLDTSNIERIEVIRGVEAAMYGPGAVGGVINIITKKGTGKPRTVTRAFGGSFGTGHIQLGSTGSRDGVSHSLAISQLTTDNAQKNNQSDKTTFSAKMQLKLDENRSVDIFTRYVTSRHEEPYELPWGSSQIELDPNIVRRQDQLALGSVYRHKLNDLFSWDASVSIYNSVSRFINEADDGSGTPEQESTSEAQVVTCRLQSRWDLDEEFLRAPGAEARVLTGLEWTWEETLSAYGGSLVPGRLRNFAGYVQGRLSMSKKILFSLGLRVDGHSTYGTNQSPAFGLRFDLWKDGSLRSNWSRAFRPPSTTELTDPWIGNPDLKKERRNGFDVGILQKLLGGKARVELTYFQVRIDDSIGWPLPTSMTVENFDTHSEGMEASVSLAPDEDTSIDLSYTHVAARNLTYDFPLMARSPNFGSVKVRRRMGKLTLTLSGYFSEKVPPEGILDEKGREQKNAGKADLVNLALLYKVTDSSKLIFKLTNILDKRYKESQRAPRVPGIGLYIGISMEL